METQGITFTIVPPGEYKVCVSDRVDEPVKIPLIKAGRAIFHKGYRFKRGDFQRWTTPLCCTKSILTTNLQHGRHAFPYIPELCIPTTREVQLHTTKNMDSHGSSHSNVQNTPLYDFLHSSGNQITYPNDLSSRLSVVVGTLVLFIPPGYYELTFNGNRVGKLPTPLCQMSGLTYTLWNARHRIKPLRIWEPNLYPDQAGTHRRLENTVI